MLSIDVVYDNKVLPSLAHMIADPIEAGGRGDVRCLVASTVRNEDTMRAFLSAKGDRIFLILRFIRLESREVQCHPLIRSTIVIET